ncbi:MAG: 2-amino-4-hydroxy-6-hydroxymethyldihydropteridine diphosphokinase [Oscillospiraceae bacterium]|nr:2-amino-4-hydroxy-6-hydroxymethyldihydropteridine diphosphokinase [Oscillospiraceae bacterium]
MDKICINGVEVFANHGAFPEEKVLGQKFVISVELYTDLRAAGKSDRLEDAVDYGMICAGIRQYVEGNVFNLIETVAEGLAEKLLSENRPVKKIRVQVKKPWAPVMAHLESVSVEIERERHTAYIALGSNMGDRESRLKSAVSRLDSSQGCSVTRVSKIIETSPYGYTEQADFLNGCLELDTLLTPEELLALLHEVENDEGRVRAERWGPRTLDLDIIFYDDIIYSTETLRIPHAEAHKRDFVLQPLCEIAPWKLHPVLGKTVLELYEQCERD